MQAIGIDIGSSTVKGAVLDPDRGTIGSVVQSSFPSPLAGLPPLYFEVDPDAVVTQVQAVARELMQNARDCAALFFTTQMGGLVIVNAERQRQSNYISWRDQRVMASDAGERSYFQRIRSRLGESVIRRLGNEIRPGNPLSLLAWLAEHGELPVEPLTPLGIGEYVLMKLCGNEPGFHITQTAGMLDITTRDWCHEAMERLGLENIRWPKIAELRDPIGEWNLDGKRLDCFAAVGDHPCALAGTGLADRNLSINISTGSQVSVRTTDPQPASDYQTRPYFDGGWLNTITHLPAGRSLNALVNLLTELSSADGETPGVWDRIAQAVDAVPETDLRLSLAFFAGPAGDRGHIENISLENLGAGHLFRAAVNNMADNYLKASKSLTRRTSCDRIVFSGGLAQKLRALAPTIAARLGMPFHIVQSNEETLQGLLELARRTMRV